MLVRESLPVCHNVFRSLRWIRKECLWTDGDFFLINFSDGDVFLINFSTRFIKYKILCGYIKTKFPEAIAEIFIHQKIYEKFTLLVLELKCEIHACQKYFISSTQKFMVKSSLEIFEKYWGHLDCDIPGKISPQSDHNGIAGAWYL